MKAESMPSAMIESCRCCYESNLGSLALEPHLPTAEREDDQDRQSKATEKPEQTGDNADQHASTDGGLPFSIEKVTHCDIC